MAHNSNKPDVNGLLVWHGLADNEEIAVMCLPIRGESHLMHLSDAEQDVAYYLFDGKSYEEIASARGTAMRTVANQVTSIFRKLSVSTREEFTAHIMGYSVPVLDVAPLRSSSSHHKKQHHKKQHRHKKASRNRRERTQGKAGRAPEPSTLIAREHRDGAKTLPSARASDAGVAPERPERKDKYRKPNEQRVSASVGKIKDAA